MKNSIPFKKIFFKELVVLFFLLSLSCCYQKQGEWLNRGASIERFKALNTTVTQAATTADGTKGGGRVGSDDTNQDGISASKAIPITVVMPKNTKGTGLEADVKTDFTFAKNAKGATLEPVVEGKISFTFGQLTPLTVTSQDGRRKRFYTVLITKYPKSEAVSLSLSIGGQRAKAGSQNGTKEDPITLTVNVPHVTDITQIPQRLTNGTGFQLPLGARITHPQGDQPIDLSPKDGVAMEVTAESGTARKYYKVIVKKDPSFIAPPAEHPAPIILSKLTTMNSVRMTIPAFTGNKKWGVSIQRSVIDKGVRVLQYKQLKPTEGKFTTISTGVSDIVLNKPLDFGTGNQTFRVSGLTPNTTYAFRVVAQAQGGGSTNGKESASVTTKKDFAKPAEYPAPVMVDKSATLSTLKLTIPAFTAKDKWGKNDRGEPYVRGTRALQYRNKSTKTDFVDVPTKSLFPAFNSTGSSQQEVMVSGLAPGEVYQFRVVATSTAGVTHGKGSLDMTMLSAAVKPFVHAAPQFMTKTTKSIKLQIPAFTFKNKWGKNAKGDAVPTGKRTLQYRAGTAKFVDVPAGQLSPAINHTGNSPQNVVVSGLKPSTSYQFRVVVSATGSGRREGYESRAITTLFPFTITYNKIIATAGSAIKTTHPTLNPTQATVTYKLKSGSTLPDGLSLYASSGAITGTPTRYGKGEFTILATGIGTYGDTQEVKVSYEFKPRDYQAVPTGFRVISRTATTLKVRWDEFKPDPSEESIVSYKLSRAPTTKPGEMRSYTFANLTAPYEITFSGLTPYTSYNITLTIQGATKKTKPISTSGTTLSVASPPSAPRNFRLLYSTRERISVAWDPPTHPGNLRDGSLATIVYYDVVLSNGQTLKINALKGEMAVQKNVNPRQVSIKAKNNNGIYGKEYGAAVTLAFPINSHFDITNGVHGNSNSSYAIDRTTGLYWQRTIRKGDWGTAKRTCEGRGVYPGEKLAGWRLPSVDELFAIQKYPNPTKAEAFGSDPNKMAWSQTPYRLNHLLPPAQQGYYNTVSLARGEVASTIYNTAQQYFVCVSSPK